MQTGCRREGTPAAGPSLLSPWTSLVAVITNDQKRGAHTTGSPPCVVQRPGVCRPGPFFLEAPEGEPSPSSLLVSGGRRPSTAGRYPTAFFAFGSLGLSPLGVSVHRAIPFSYREPSWWVRAPPIQDALLLTPSHLQRPHLQIRLLSQFWALGFQFTFLANIAQPATGSLCRGALSRTQLQGRMGVDERGPPWWGGTRMLGRGLE